MTSDTVSPASRAQLVAWRDAATTGELPLPTRGDRWQPLRAGLVNLWEYDVAEVWYGDGRLQLQGANESGKSTLMTLTTLLLLTGDISGHNIDTLGESGKRFWYYVEPTDHPLDRRDTSAGKHRGWAWAEYGRQGPNGPEFFTTLLFAEARRADGGKKLHWCTTHGTPRGGPARVRCGITLISAGLVAEPGQLHDVPGFVAHKTGALYRDEIARTLFTTDTSWLDQVIRILRVVRTPKIGDRLDLKFLTKAFRTALPPLAEDEINQLADGWEQLERMRNERDTTEQAVAEITDFTRGRWRSWADAVIRSSADPVITATSALTQVTRDERTANEAVDRLSVEERTLDDRIVESRDTRRDAMAEREALRETQAYQDAVAAAANAQQLAETAHRAEGLARRSAERVRMAQDKVPDAERRLAAAKSRADAADGEVERAAGRIAAQAERAGLVEVTARHLPERDTARLRQVSEQRTRFAEHAERLHDKHTEAARQADAAVEKAQETARAAEAARRRADDAAQAVEAAIIAVGELLATWATELPLRLRPAPSLLEGWVRRVTAIADADPPTPVLAASGEREHLAPTRRPLEARAAQLDHGRVATREALTAARDELEVVEAETDPRPDPPVLWRRRERPEGISVAGAPLWRLIEATPSLPAGSIAALEAALDAAGLLQAWVTPDGAYLLNRDSADTVWVSAAVGAGAAAAPPAWSTRTLRAALTPADDCGPELGRVVDALLRTVAYRQTLPDGDRDSDRDGAGDVVIAADGRWRHGGLTGTAVPTAEEPQLLGAAARAAARAKRIRALQGRIAELQAEVDRLEASSAEVAADLAALDQAADRLRAADAPVVAAVVALRHARGAEQIAVQAMERAAELASAARGEADKAAAAVAAHADEHRLPRTRDQVKAVLQALGAYLAAVHDLATAVKQVPPLREALEAAVADLETRQAAHAQATKDADHDREAARTLRAKADAAKAALTQEVCCPSLRVRM